LTLDDVQNLYYELLKKYGVLVGGEEDAAGHELYELGHALRFSDELLDEFMR
jgi:hypothetical protein